MTTKKKRLVATGFALIAVCVGVAISLRVKETNMERAALKSAGLADVPSTANDHKVSVRSTFLHDQVNVYFADSAAAVEKWKHSSPGLTRATPLSGQLARPNTFTFASPGNEGVTVAFDPNRGTVSVTVFIPK